MNLAEVRSPDFPGERSDGLPVHHFETVLADLVTQARVTQGLGAEDATFDRLTSPTTLKQGAFALRAL